MLDNLAPNVVAIQDVQPGLKLGSMADFHRLLADVLFNPGHASLAGFPGEANGCRP